MQCDTVTLLKIDLKFFYFFKLYLYMHCMYIKKKSIVQSKSSYSEIESFYHKFFLMISFFLSNFIWLMIFFTI